MLEWLVAILAIALPAYVCMCGILCFIGDPFLALLLAGAVAVILKKCLLGGRL